MAVEQIFYCELRVCEMEKGVAIIFHTEEFASPDANPTDEYPSRMQATTLDEVITHLDAIIETAKREKSRIGYFASLYRMMTIAVQAGIQAGRFEDPQRMTRLDVIFANRYLTAYARHRRSEAPTRVWRYAFAVAKANQALILQDLLLGVNAHINLDLGVAAAEACPQAQYAPLKRDFEMINMIIAELTEGVQAEIGRLSPLFGGIDEWLGVVDEAIFGFSINHARDAAWRMGKAMCVLDARQTASAINLQDKSIDVLSRLIFNRHMAQRITFKLIRASEEQDVVKVIDVLSDVAERRAVALIPETARQLRRLRRLPRTKARRTQAPAPSSKRRA
jgi:hypothetical protein